MLFSHQHEVLAQGLAFTDVIQAADLNINHNISPSAPMSSVMTGGVAVADIDNDGDGMVDLLLGGYAGSGVHILFNNGNTTFTENINTGIDNQLNRNDYSATMGDPDRDGDLALFISHWGPNAGFNHLWINDGNGQFPPR